MLSCVRNMKILDWVNSGLANPDFRFHPVIRKICHENSVFLVSQKSNLIVLLSKANRDFHSKENWAIRMHPDECHLATSEGRDAEKIVSLPKNNKIIVPRWVDTHRQLNPIYGAFCRRFLQFFLKGLFFFNIKLLFNSQARSER